MDVYLNMHMQTSCIAHVRPEIALRIFHKGEAKSRVATVLQTTPMNYRVDAHISSRGSGGAPAIKGKPDCLHMCYGIDGGPLALLPRLLLHALVARWIQLKSGRDNETVKARKAAVQSF